MTLVGGGGGVTAPGMTLYCIYIAMSGFDDA